MKYKIKDAEDIMKKLKLNINDFNFNYKELKRGMNIELEHGKINKLTNITNNNKIMTGKIALAHLLEDPKYYEKLKKIEKHK